VNRQAEPAAIDYYLSLRLIPPPLTMFRGICKLPAGHWLEWTAAAANGLAPVARVVASAAAGVEPRLMGMGPVPATRIVLDRAKLTLDQMDVIELNEAFAAQALAVLRELEIDDDDPRVNPNGGAIAIGHPLGMSGARLALTAMRELQRRKARYALCTMCIGVGQGFAMILERV
jgi:acetyl-CoA acetyltransferase